MLATSFSLSRADLLANFDDSSLNWLGLNWDSPTIVVSDVPKAIQFYEKVFGFVPVFILPDETNEITFARMRYRGTYFTLTSEHDDAGESASRLGCETQSSAFYLYVDDVEQVLANAQEHGSRTLEAPHVDFFGDHKARLIDIFGHIWDIAARL